MKEIVIGVVGPTAVGKTSLSVEIAKAFNGEVISGDSMQIYRGMDIGTAKVTEEEQEGIPHHMLDIRSPDESFSVAEFQTNVKRYVQEITSRGNLPIIAGGTGLYIEAALYDYQFADQKRDESLQARIEKEIETNGMDVIYERLRKVDPEQAEKIHPNNVRRVIRALEVYERTGSTMSEMHQKQSKTSPYHPILIGLEMERSLLYDRINHRVDLMMTEGLLEEVKRFYQQGLEDAQAMQAIGYKEFIPYFKGHYSLTEAVELLKRNSRRYAKRQYTWFKNKMNVHWYSINPEEKNEKFQIILNDLAGMIKKT
ncbi:tRNA dimethylallyltransferase [Natronobacillus azotifigens]|uniref:tRNA dimethylallyltransferase n=1 Tax=Natronobacillus azotifigens TaxID=472978 RepID=A0A9J6RAP1_9BACI|nr:tRNA (adenosine(37)-N6)-dimethylallyltransferase MiaA [Natronobacillus azotifigens]MCZ0702637.1 tRNA (adenosine(37)-N6)-dimethylallyltransferase MiaA [Natronobacillus azotifigens]